MCADGESDYITFAAGRVKMSVMLSGGDGLSVQVEAEVGGIISALNATEWVVSTSLYEAKSFGNWYVDLRRGEHTIRLVKDRSQYMIEGSEIQEIKSAGLWHAFDDLGEFNQAVTHWITSHGSSNDAKPKSN